jgi:hypothetical protein
LFGKIKKIPKKSDFPDAVCPFNKESSFFTGGAIIVEPLAKNPTSRSEKLASSLEIDGKL